MSHVTMIDLRRRRARIARIRWFRVSNKCKRHFARSIADIFDDVAFNVLMAHSL